MSDSLTTPRCTAAFVHIWTPQTAMNGRPLPEDKHRYSITGVFTDEKMKEIKGACRPVVAEQFPNGVPKDLKVPWVSCTAKNQARISLGKEPFAGYDDGSFAVAFNRYVADGRVGVANHLVQPIAAADNMLYAGCIVIIRYRPYVTVTHDPSGRLCFQLEHVQVVGAGSPLVARSVPVEQAFTPTEYDGDYAAEESGFNVDEPF